jgi:hypothetical protein
VNLNDAIKEPLEKQHCTRAALEVALLMWAGWVLFLAPALPVVAFAGELCWNVAACPLGLPTVTFLQVLGAVSLLALAAMFVRYLWRVLA